MLSGSEDQKHTLMNMFLDKLLEGHELTDAENAMFECLRTYFLDKDKPIIANMSAVMTGQGNMR